MSATTKPISHRQLYSPPPRFFFGPHARLSTAHSRILQQRFANCSRAPGCRDANARGVSELKDRPLHALLFSSMSCQSQSFLPKEEQWERKRGGGGGKTSQPSPESSSSPPPSLSSSSPNTLFCDSSTHPSICQPVGMMTALAQAYFFLLLLLVFSSSSLPPSLYQGTRLA